MSVEIEKAGIAPFKTYRGVYADLPGRPGARTEVFVINFELAGGGMGDYICWLPALEWISKNCPWVYGRIWAPGYFIQFVKHIFKGVKNWEVLLIDHYKSAEKGTLCRGLQTTPAQLLNATGAHLLKIGFGNFANMDEIPEGTTYPQADLSEVKLNKKLKGLEKKYVVFTPGGTTRTRFVPAKYWNPLISWVKEQGLTPVFLGKALLADVHKAYFDNDINFDQGIDLREQTTTLEAARVMKDAACTIGLDNGLLHLAACTDAPIVFGYNIVKPGERRPIRPTGKMAEVYLSDKELGCNFCQSKFKLLYTHNYKNCIYNDLKCIDLLFEQEGLRWKKAMLEIL